MPRQMREARRPGVPRVTCTMSHSPGRAASRFEWILADVSRDSTGCRSGRGTREQRPRECDREVHAADYLSLARNPVSRGKTMALVPATFSLAQSDTPGL